MAVASSQHESSSGLPEGVARLHLQIAGHFHGMGPTGLGMLQSQDGWVLKPVQSPPRGTRELDFYDQVFNKDNRDSVILRLRKLLPHYAGKCELEIGSETIPYIKIENITAQFRQACVLDIKMGQRTFDPLASKEKIEYEMSKNRYAQNVGFRFLGMQLYDGVTGRYASFDKQWGKQIRENDILLALRSFLGRCPCDRGRRVAVKQFLSRLEEVRSWFLEQRLYAFYASSLLLVYEGGAARSRDARSKVEGSRATEEVGSHTDLRPTDEEPCIFCENLYETDTGAYLQDGVNRRRWTDVRMIDCAHVFPSEERDDNYLFGLNKLIDYFESV
ncbi:PREDICTED: inositol polyphosphate multikinase-like [Priapulus caudatus]|uniref:Kinase n=1 Tax=Priapulus caudatus TaxID=37621 RepID=A0ABM1DZ83_PRICU|nr:PREDICTED: inositol polyphosphate multikinase-like [Priapulus caudatus]